MKLIQGIIILITSAVFTILLYQLLLKFERKDLFWYGLIPLLVFIIGFVLRLSGDGIIIDAGFFMTEGIHPNHHLLGHNTPARTTQVL